MTTDNTLTAKEKANLFAFVLNFGHFNYFDKCEWNAKAHKYRYYDADECKVHYISIRGMASDFEKIFTAAEIQEIAADYYDYEKCVKLSRE